jgi:hypothetical protein
LRSRCSTSLFFSFWCFWPGSASVVCCFKYAPFAPCSGTASGRCWDVKNHGCGVFDTRGFGRMCTQIYMCVGGEGGGGRLSRAEERWFLAGSELQDTDRSRKVMMCLGVVTMNGFMSGVDVSMRCGK